ncbi:Uncharacterised protein [Legionella bozemanae]|nr:Uncharacterised protein [Legionella bozemanae]
MINCVFFKHLGFTKISSLINEIVTEILRILYTMILQINYIKKYLCSILE